MVYNCQRPWIITIGQHIASQWPGWPCTFPYKDLLVPSSAKGKPCDLMELLMWGVELHMHVQGNPYAARWHAQFHAVGVEGRACVSLVQWRHPKCCYCLSAHPPGAMWPTFLGMGKPKQHTTQGVATAWLHTWYWCFRRNLWQLKI